MRLLSTRKLDARGFAHHFLLPVVAVLVVAGIGAYVLDQSHAATDLTYYTSSCNSVTYGAPNSTVNGCVKDAQVLLNGVQHHAAQNTLKLSVYAGSSFQYGNLVYLLMNGLYGKYTALAVTAVTGNANGQLTSGQTGSWQNLCRSAVAAGLNNDSGTLNFSSATGVTGGSVAALKAGITNAAAFSAACGKQMTATTSSTGSAGKTNGGAPSAPVPVSTATAACTARTFQSGAKDSGSSHCVQYLQQILNGADAYYFTLVQGASAINSEPMSTLGSSSAFIVGGGFGNTTNVYDSRTVTAISRLQAWVNSSGTDKSVLNYNFNIPTATFNKEFKPNGNLPTNGATEAKTWYAVCQFTNQIPASARAVTNSTDYTGGKPNSAGSNKTNMWYTRSYMRAGVSAASAVGC
ncbi:MAG TPA: hypothetical protein VGM08_01235 [Candidatus Saccharimonadales bacterium]|jgi:hypothetical protein